MTDKTLGACQCHEKHAPTYWKGVVREYKDALEKAESRPLTPDAITDEMVERALVVNTDLRPETVRRMLTAALTEPPARPEGAEDIEALVEESLSGDALSDAQVRALADFLAARLADPTRKGA